MTHTPIKVVLYQKDDLDNFILSFILICIAINVYH